MLGGKGGYMNQKPKDHYRVFAPNVPDVLIISERFTSEVDAQRAKRTILMMYPAATVRIEKTDESGRAQPGNPPCHHCVEQRFASHSIPLFRDRIGRAMGKINRQAIARFVLTIHTLRSLRDLECMEKFTRCFKTGVQTCSQRHKNQ